MVQPDINTAKGTAEQQHVMDLFGSKCTEHAMDLFGSKSTESRCYTMLVYGIKTERAVRGSRFDHNMASKRDLRTTPALWDMWENPPYANAFTYSFSLWYSSLPLGREFDCEQLKKMASNSDENDNTKKEQSKMFLRAEKENYCSR